MARYSNVHTDFSGGLVSDNMVGRADLKKLSSSTRTFTNFFPELQGPAVFRKGFERLQTTSSDISSSKSVVLTLATGLSYRVVFTSLALEVYKVEGNILKTATPVSSPYSLGDLELLRFSSETDGLYITHPTFRPAKLTTGLVQSARLLQSTESDGTNDILQSTESDGTNLSLGTAITVQGDTNWTLEEIDFEFEPYLPPLDSSIKFTLAEGTRLIKLEQEAAFNGAAVGDYVEYQIDGEWYLGEITNDTVGGQFPEVANPTADVVYVNPVSSVLDINDPDARLFLLDNLETGTNVETIGQLEQDFVPENEIHVRSDVLVFRKGFEGSWLRVGDDRRSNDVVVGQNRTTTRWVKLSEHLGSQDHPVDFIRSNLPFSQENISQGSTYKIMSYHGQPLKKFYVIGPDVDGNLNKNTGFCAIPTGNRVFVNTNGLSQTKASSLAAPNNEYGAQVSQVLANGVVANLSTQKVFDVMKCDASADKVEEGTNLFTTTGSIVITTISNSATLIASEAGTFTSSEVTVGRHFMLEFISGNVFAKCIKYENGRQISLLLLNKVPKSSRTLEYENKGQLESLRKGAWYTGNYPQTVAKYEQRRVYGGTFANPNFVFFSEVDNDRSFKPTEDDKDVLDTNGFTYELANRTASISWLLPLKDLVIGTSGGLYRVVPNQYQYGVSPKTARIELSQEEPCLEQGVIVGNTIFYPDAAGTRLLEYKYEANIANSSSNDVSKFIFPIFNTDDIIKIDYQHSPTPKIWVLVRSGLLYCLTYHRQEEYYAWSKQDLGKVTDIVVLPKSGSELCDSLIATVERTDTTGTVYTFEKLNELQVYEPVAGAANSKKTVSHLDSFKAYTKNSTGNLVITMTTDGYAIGDLVDVVVDGKYEGQKTIASANTFTGYTIPANTNTLIVGKKFEGELKMIHPTWDGSNKPAFGAETIRVISVKPFLVNSVKYDIGIANQFNTRNLISSLNYDNDSLFTGFDKELPLVGSTFGVDKTAVIKQTEPYPLTVASLVTKTDLN
tara:strand:- start:7968 stop:11003 length:3036 start_codon:yes stop_codon:yes gene_type:complete